MRFKLRCPSAPTILSLLAIFVALGGTATAGIVITRSSQLGKNVVTGSKIKNKTIKGADIGNSTVSASKLSKSAFARIKGLGTKGLLGDKGPTGETGSKGPQGDPGIDGQVGADGAPGNKGPTGNKGPQGDIGPSAIALVGQIKIDNTAQSCGWSHADDYLVPEGETAPTLEWVQDGVCKLTFAAGGNVKWATAEALSGYTSWSKVVVNRVESFVYVKLLNFPSTYGDPPVATQGDAYVVVYRGDEQ